MRSGCAPCAARTLADTVGDGMRLLICGVNPSLFSADVGIGYGRPGNRFWSAALAAGIVGRTATRSMPWSGTAWG